MQVVHLVAGALDRGAAQGARCLHAALRELGVDSNLLTDSHSTAGHDAVASVAETALGRISSALLRRLGQLPEKIYRNREPRIFHTGFEGFNVARHPAVKAADIVHLHWINGLVSMRSLRRIDKPIVWTLRDMWPLTGGCHYSFDCTRYTAACGRCPQLRSRHKYDLSRLVVYNKLACIPTHLHPVAISKWLAECARNSRVLAGRNIEVISNNVNTREFYPLPKTLAREALGLTGDRKLVLVGAQHVTDFYKGFDLFVDALACLNRLDLHFMFFGRVSKSLLDTLGLEYTNLGFLCDVVSLRLAYAAADVFVAPSRMDAFGKTLAEAMACATPVVCFDATGPRDVVAHKLTGYRARAFEPADLAEGLRWVIDRPANAYKALCRNARERAVTLFDSQVIAGQYHNLYSRILEESAQ